jgi:hypothetical protein
MVSKTSHLHCHLPFLPLACHISACTYAFLLSSGIDIDGNKRALNLTHGSSTLVLELGVEEIAAADGGNVEACDLTFFCQSLLFLLSLFSFLFLSCGFCGCSIYLSCVVVCDGKVVSIRS